MKKISSLLLSAALSLFSAQVFAGDVASSPNTTTVTEFTGTLTVTINGVAKTYNAGDTVPPIPSGATIGVEGGSASLAVGKVAVNLPAGASVKPTVTAGGKKASVAVITGSAEVAGKSVPAGKTAKASTTQGAARQASASGSDTVADAKVTVTIANSPNQDKGVSCTAGVSPSAPC